MQDGSKKAIIAAFLANAAIAVAKLVGFFLTGAASMLAEAVHSSADAGNQGLLFLGGARARKTATPEHPFGYGRERYFWSFVVALVLFTLGGLFALYEGIEKLRHPHEIESATVAFVILTIAIIVESHLVPHRHQGEPPRQGQGVVVAVHPPVEVAGAAGRPARGPGRPCRPHPGGRRAGHGRDHRQPPVGRGGQHRHRQLLVVIAVILVIEMKGLLIGEAASPATLASIQQTMESTNRVKRVIHVKTQHIGPDELLVGAKLAFDASLDLPALAEAINEVEHRLRQAVPTCRVIYIEPDIERSAGGPGGRQVAAG